MHPSFPPPGFSWVPFFFAASFFKDFVYFFSERGKGKEKEREKNINERNINIFLLICTPWLGTKLATPACALTRNWTRDLSLCGTMPNKLSHTILCLLLLFIFIMSHSCLCCGIYLIAFGGLRFWLFIPLECDKLFQGRDYVLYPWCFKYFLNILVAQWNFLEQMKKNGINWTFLWCG